MLKMKVTQCTACVSANTRFHQLRWGDREWAYYTPYARNTDVHVQCTCIGIGGSRVGKVSVPGVLLAVPLQEPRLTRSRVRQAVMSAVATGSLSADKTVSGSDPTPCVCSSRTAKHTSSSVHS